MFNARWWLSNHKTAGGGSRTSVGDSGKATANSVKASTVLREELAKADADFSAERLRTLYGLLTGEPVIGDANSPEIVAVLRIISEILIWGDKNDPSVFEVFLEKHMLAYFVSILQQCGAVFTGNASPTTEPSNNETSPCPSPSSLSASETVSKKPTSRVAAAAEVFSITAARHVCKQILQLLHILFENISQDTSLYFLLSNNFINQIIECPFDFTDDEILAHYVSLLKILSNKLNSHTIHFFCQEEMSRKNEAPPDTVPVFPLFSRALSLFTFPETMVRIAARTVVLNCFRVRDLTSPEKSYIRSPELPRQLLECLLSILTSQVERMKAFLDQSNWIEGFRDESLYQEASSDHAEDMLNVKQRAVEAWSDQQKQGSAFQDMMIEHMEYVQYLNDLLDLRVEPLNSCVRSEVSRIYVLPFIVLPISGNLEALRQNDDLAVRRSLVIEIVFSLVLLSFVALNLTNISLILTDAERLGRGLRMCLSIFDPNDKMPPFDDRLPLFALMFLVVLMDTCAKSGEKMDVMLDVPSLLSTVVPLIQRTAVSGFSICRVIVLRLACIFVDECTTGGKFGVLEDQHLAVLLDAREQSCLLLRRFFRNDDAFIGLVELEVHIQRQFAKGLHLEKLLDKEITALIGCCPRPVSWKLNLDTLSAAEVVRPISAKVPTTAQEKGFPDLCKRWPLSLDEKCRYYLRIFFTLRRLTNKVQKNSVPSSESVSETAKDSSGDLKGLLPSSSTEEMPAPFQSVQIGDVVDINNCDTILSCTVVPFHTHLANRPSLNTATRPPQTLLCPSDEEKWVKRFLIVHQWQMLFVEPDNRKLGYAVVKETYVLPSVQLLNEKEQREKIVCCCSLATNPSNHRSHDVNALSGTESKILVKSIFFQVQMQLPQKISTSISDAPWNMDNRFEALMRVVFDDSIRAMAASTRVRKNQERIRELKLTAINTLLDLPAGTAHPNYANAPGSSNDTGSTRLSFPSSRSSTGPNSPAIIHESLSVPRSHHSGEMTHSRPKSSSKSAGREKSRDRTRSSKETKIAPGTAAIPMTRLDVSSRAAGFTMPRGYFRSWLHEKDTESPWDMPTPPSRPYQLPYHFDEPRKGVSIYILRLNRDCEEEHLQKSLFRLFKSHVLVIHLSVESDMFGSVNGHLVVPTVADMRNVVKMFQRTTFFGRSMEFSEVDPNLPPPVSFKKAVTQVFVDLNKQRLPLTELTRIFEEQYDLALGISELMKMPEIVERFTESGVQMIRLLPAALTWRTHLASMGCLDTQQLSYCTKCFPQPPAPGFIARNATVSVTCFRVPLVKFRENVLALLNFHGGSMNVNSFISCYEVHFGTLEENENEGIFLEQLLRSVDNVSFKQLPYESRKIVLNSPDLDAVDENSMEFRRFRREIHDMLLTQRRSTLPFGEFVQTYRMNYGKTCRVADFGCTRLIDLLGMFSTTFHVIGTGANRLLALTHAAQKRRFLRDLEDLRQRCGYSTVTVFNFNHLYSSVFKREFDPTHFGVCYAEDLLADFGIVRPAFTPPTMLPSCVMKKLMKQGQESSPTPKPKHFDALDFIRMVGSIGKPIDTSDRDHPKGPSNALVPLETRPADTGTPPGQSPLTVTHDKDVASESEEEDTDEDNSHFYSFSSGDTDESGEVDTVNQDFVTDSGTEGSISPAPSASGDARMISSRLALRF